MGHFGEQVATVLAAIIGLATVSVLVSRNANTPAVISAGANAFANAVRVAVSPVTGGTGALSNPIYGPAGGFTGQSGFPTIGNFNQ